MIESFKNLEELSLDSFSIQDIFDAVPDDMQRIIKAYYQTEFTDILENKMAQRVWKNFPATFNRARAEYGLAYDYHMVLARDKWGHDRLAGYIPNQAKTASDPRNLFTSSGGADKSDIVFFNNRDWAYPDYMKELSEFTPTHPNGFVVLRNKLVNYTSDQQKLRVMLAHWIKIQASLLLTIEASKLLILFKSDPNNDTIKNAVHEMWNNSLILEVGQSFDFEDSMQVLDTKVHDRIKTLEDASRDQLNNIHARFGLSAKSTEKESGVSEIELQKNDDSNNSRERVYLGALNDALALYNSNYGTDYEVEL